MREILFRGKRLDNGEWVAGWFVRLHSGESKSNRIYTGYAEKDCGEYFPDWFEVDPATVGQYTGLTGRAGQKIFEGDIMRFSAYGYDYVGEVTFENGSFCIACKPPRSSTKPYCDFAIDRYGAEKIGNRWDNPELLEEANVG